MTGLSKKQLEMLKGEFPHQAYSKDTSRGFELTSVKAAYVSERLNDVFGVCGTGWHYVHSPFEIETAGGSDEVMTEVALQYRTENESGVGLVRWENTDTGWGWSFSDEGTWSLPIFAVGGHFVLKNRMTDARKSAVTNGIGKAASMLGVGHEAFKGEITAGRQQQQGKQSSSPAEQKRQRAKQQAAKQSADPAKAALYATKKGTKLGTLPAEKLQVIIKADDVSGELQQAAKTLFNFISEKVGATDPEATYNSITGTQG